MLKKRQSPRNIFEKRVARQLRRHKMAFAYESERIPYVVASHYIPDFVVTLPNGKLYIETKGYLRPESKRKMVAIKKQHPELDIRIVFYEKRASNVKWAERHGFKYAFEKIPKEWLDGL